MPLVSRAVAHFTDGTVCPVLETPDGPCVLSGGRLWRLAEGLPDITLIGEPAMIVAAPPGLTAAGLPAAAVEIDPSAGVGFVWVQAPHGELVRSVDLAEVEALDQGDDSDESTGGADRLGEQDDVFADGEAAR